eukprot:CAMPEP_0198322308 /NCGR_PEP_ID=MMETSP1450-20131203/10818_1 /TAXON_ID=753684 ORGANISM="Madagascaria erythrocladiodes, Strain CCMP3234" /NCGR_SAMPLE_ID=MMETSP1450 /ASSEMBLY_ACC=CAM_ASM_001115 /LENGTH=114 /DNA_ID=CAMNT_0044025917 /DNA_START=29 /DNA_END=373 /DNA_ORIENTATION=-
MSAGQSLKFLYKESTVGQALQDTIEEMKEEGALDDEAGELLLEHLGKAVLNVLSNKVTNKATLKGKLKEYKNVDNIWRLVIKDAIFRHDSSTHESLNVTSNLEVTALDNKYLSS